MKKHVTKIAFDAGPMVYGNLTGVGRSTIGLIEALSSNYPNDIELVGHYFDFLGRSNRSNLPHAPNIRYRRTVLVPGKIFNMLRRLGIWVPYELFTKERADFHLFPGFIGWPSLFKTPSAPFIHDITYLQHPEYVNGPAQFDLRTIVPRTIKRADFILTNSESSRAGIIKEYPHANKPVLVEYIPPVAALKIGKTDSKNRIRKLGITKPYYLFLGTLEPRKNLTSLVDAFSLLPEGMRNTYSLVISGGKGWKDEEILKKIDHLKATGGSVIQTGYVSDEDRAALFMNATTYIMPSHYEGFGMQLLEGMSYQTPMIVSDIPVLREVGQKASLYCSTDAQSIARAIANLTDDKILQEKLKKEGAKRLRDFSWEHVAVDVYKQINLTISKRKGLKR